MALALSQNDLKVLDQTRQRLSQLTKTLQSLLGQIHASDPLPAWTELTQLASVIAQNVAALSALLAENEPLLSALAAYPVPKYPGRSHEALLEQLLRKKLEPDAEDWVAQGERVATAAAAASSSSPAHLSGQDDADQDAASKAGGLEAQRALWGWAPQSANEQARRHLMYIGADYTRAEVEGGVDKVATGLRRRLEVPEEDSSGDEDDDDDDEDDDGDVAVVDAEPDDGTGLVGVRRGSEAAGGVEFDLTGKKDAPAPRAALGVVAQLRFMTTGALRR